MIDETDRDLAVHERADGAPAPGAEDEWTALFLRVLFAVLDDEGIRWLILRNHQDIPDRIGHDVDLIVHPRDDGAIDALMRSVIAGLDLFLIRSYRGIDHRTFDVASPDLAGRLVLHVDVQTSMRFRGRVLIGGRELLRDRRRVGTLWTPSPGTEAFGLLLHAGLNKRALKPKYAARVTELEEIEPGSLERAARRSVGTDLGAGLAAVRTEEQLLELRPRLRRAVDRRHPANRLRRPAFEVRSALTQTWLRIRPRGLFVVFLGPDGSGKSSTVELVAALLGSQPGVLPVHRVYLGSGTPVLPTRKLARRLHERSSGGSKVVRDVAPRRLRGALHVTADEIARYWIQVRPRMSPHGLVLADRYAYDLFRVNNPVARHPWFRRLMLLVIAEPHVTFFLEGDPEVIAARKGELTIEETTRQQRAYRELAPLIGSFHPIDLTTRDDDALRQVAAVILDAYARRNRGMPRRARPRTI
jgi:thymidylate kinase